MVRLKQRYILFEILYPPTEDIPNLSVSPSTSILTVHRESPGNISPKTIINTIRSTVQEYYGDHGSGYLMAMNIKYFNNKTSSGIIRCNRTNFQYIMGSLPMITTIDGKPVIVNCSHVSGTIKKCEDFAIESNRSLIRRIRYLQKIETGQIDIV